MRHSASMNGREATLSLWWESQTVHQKIMNGLAYRGFDPDGAIISTVRCQKTLV